jgi:hypothetical protein
MSRARYYCQILNRFSKNKKMSSAMKIGPVGAELFRVDGQTDMTKLTVAFRNFANAPKNKRSGNAQIPLH